MRIEVPRMPGITVWCRACTMYLRIRTVNSRRRWQRYITRRRMRSSLTWGARRTAAARRRGLSRLKLLSSSAPFMPPSLETPVVAYHDDGFFDDRIINHGHSKFDSEKHVAARIRRDFHERELALLTSAAKSHLPHYLAILESANKQHFRQGIGQL
jgi:hypothetical protein